MAVLVAACSPSDRPIGADPCQTDADCASDKICHAGECAQVECKLDSDCAADQHCQDHACIPDEGCASDADCMAPTGRCDLQRSECVECLDTTDCAPDQGCLSGGVCGAGGCQTDSDCSTPTPRCDASSGLCRECIQTADCPADQECQAYQCQPIGCVADADCQAPTPRCDVASGVCLGCLETADCQPGQICSAGVCAAEPVCVEDDQCEMGQICLDGDCLTGCRSERDCPQDQTCRDDLGDHGRCVECSTPDDCDPGWTCEQYACVPHCTQDDHCTPLHCDLDSNQCVACIQDEHCDRSAGLICEALTCVLGCRQDADCAGDFCDLATNACVDCLTSDHCSLGLICAELQCVVGCESDRDCPDGRLCDPQAGPHGGCVECLEDGDCDPAYLCRSGLCEFHCATDADCQAPTPACDATDGTCVACTTDDHCGPGTICVGQQCVPGCAVDADCPADQVCDPNLGAHGGCVDCRVDGDCPDGFACQGNRCLLQGEQTIRIAGGAFLRGSDPGEGDADEEPEQSIELPTFYIDRTEVTNEQYRACVLAGGCTEPFEMNAYNDPARARHPVVYISWSQAVAYCAFKGMELPTEARWERAARGPAPDERTFPWGDSAPNCARTNYSGCLGGTDIVGARPNGASPEDVLDMAGNVWEWVQDQYVADYYTWGNDSDPQGPGYGDYRVVRGGAYDGLAEHVRCANRASRPPDQASPNVGLRCAMVGAPLASFTVTPEQAPYDTLFWVDASGSSDPNHALDALEVRWDWESDGTWDTTWSTGKTATHRYAAPGFYTISLQVRDPDGNTADAAVFVVAEGTDGWDGDPCAADSECASGFVCVAPLLSSDYRCRQMCLFDPTCSYPDYTCETSMWIEGLPIMKACMP